MFVQIHILQSIPPGNLNRDETGQPKKCLFGGVTRARISSQCLKRNIRHSAQFAEVYGEALADRTKFLPQMVADALQAMGAEMSGAERGEVMTALASKFKKENKGEDRTPYSAAGGEGVRETGQLVFFPQSFAQRIAELLVAFRGQNREAYDCFLGRNISKEQRKQLEKQVSLFEDEIALASKTLTVDIGLFGRMTTSDLVVNVDAACQVAHSISTHEAFIESDYFTAMDDRKAAYAQTQSQTAGAAFLGSGDSETYFNAAVHYKYFNLDTDALRVNVPELSADEVAQAAAVFLKAAALVTPSGKQNSFAAYAMPEFVLVEVSKTKRPVSYANAFLQPVEGGTNRNLMTESANALQGYVDAIAAAFAPADLRRVVLAVGATSIALTSAHQRVATLDELAALLIELVTAPEGTRVTA